ncbi:MAG: N-formylglutamate amidohydrolase [Planctomycetes bacterium]|nr:N-formylglutamate amidohydrolase [Planctomycetota bacterium]
MGPDRRPALLLSCEHASRALPRTWRPWFRGWEEALAGHRGADAGARRLARELAESFGAPLLEGRWSRLLVDLNRPAEHPGCVGRPLRRLPPAAQRELLESYWTPWHAVLRAELARLLELPGGVLHLSVHSFTPVWKGRPRAVDVGVLDDPARAAERRLSGQFLGELRRRLPGWRIRRNLPYRGWTAGTVSTLRREFPGDGYRGIELEVSQAVVAGGGWRRCRAAVSEALAAVCQGDRRPAR